MAVGLLASRILLKELGTDDYGLYNLVGSVVMVFASLRVILATSTQRFLNYETKENNIHLKAVIFTTSEKIHWILCGIFFLVAEIGGLYLINTKIDIPNDMYGIAHILLQLSIFTAITTITTIPYDAVIISNENFDVYAILSITESILKLLSAYFLFFLSSWKIIYYGVFILLSAIIIRIVNIIYCKHHYQECKIKVKAEKGTAKELCKFAGWNFLGNTAYTICNEGINIVINIFGGVIANAARAIAYQVYNAVSEICAKIISAASPQAIKIYAQEQFFEFNNVVGLSTKIIIFLYLIIALPISLLTKDVLYIWLGEIPEHSIIFIQVILVYGWIRAIHFPLDLCFKASGKMASYQITELLCLLPSIPAAYVFLKYGFPLYYAFISLIICNIINTVLIIYLAQKKSHLDLRLYLVNSLIPSVLLTICGIIVLFSVSLLNSSFIKLILIELSICFFMYFLCIPRSQRKQINKIFSKIKRH